MPGNFGEFRTGDLGESGTRGLRGIMYRGLGVFQIHRTFFPGHCRYGL